MKLKGRAPSLLNQMSVGTFTFLSSLVTEWCLSAPCKQQLT